MSDISRGYDEAIKQLQAELAGCKADKNRQAQNLDAEIERLQVEINKEMPDLQLANVKLQADLDETKQENVDLRAGIECGVARYNKLWAELVKLKEKTNLNCKGKDRQQQK